MASWFFNAGFVVSSLIFGILMVGKVVIGTWLRQNPAVVSIRTYDVRPCRFAVGNYTTVRTSTYG
jgi:hypothetical protein